MRILGTRHCRKERHKAFKIQDNLHYVLCRRDYAEWVVSSFAQQIQSDYYSGSRSVSIEAAALYHFSKLQHPSQFLT